MAAIAAAVLVLAIGWALFVPLADGLAHHDVGSATGPLHETALDNARGRLLTLGAGLVAAGALVFTALNLRLLRRNSEQAERWQRRTHELTEQGQVTDRYTKAIEQLGSKELDVRIGGIYALERIARDSARDYPTVLEVLTAFIREHSLEPWPPQDHSASQEQERSTRPDIQAALTVVGRRNLDRDVQLLNLGRADLSGADLSRAELSGTNLFRVQFDGAELYHANLASAHLIQAHFNGAELVRAILAGADLSGADLVDANLAEADLTGADLSVTDLTRASLVRADLTGADLDSADLTGADLTGAKWPSDAPIPEGWKRDANSGRLTRPK
jgi:hypothetical protein